MKTVFIALKGYFDITQSVREILGHTVREKAQIKSLKKAVVDRGSSICASSYELFPDGERYHVFENDVRDTHIVIVGGTHSDQNTLDLFDLAYAAWDLGAAKLTLMIPYFGYSTMERRGRRTDATKGKSRAVLLSRIPAFPLGNTAYLLDVHADANISAFEEPMKARHIYGKSAIMAHMTKQWGSGFVLGSTDNGRAKWIESIASELGVETAMITKRRSAGSTRITSVSADVKGKTVVIYDDLLRSGGSAAAAADEYCRRGATDVHVVVTHAPFTAETNGPCSVIAKLFSYGVTSLSFTDSHPAVDYQFGWAKGNPQRHRIHHISVAPILAETLKTIL